MPENNVVRVLLLDQVPGSGRGASQLGLACRVVLGQESASQEGRLELFEEVTACHQIQSSPEQTFTMKEERHQHTRNRPIHHTHVPSSHSHSHTTQVAVLKEPFFLFFSPPCSGCLHHTNVVVSSSSSSSAS
jgi:hypothetical protein